MHLFYAKMNELEEIYILLNKETLWFQSFGQFGAFTEGLMNMHAELYTDWFVVHPGQWLVLSLE